LRGSHFRYAIHKVLLARGLTGLSEQSGRAGHISLGQFQAGKKHLTENKSVNNSIILPRQVEALLPVLPGFIQVISTRTLRKNRFSFRCSSEACIYKLSSW
jgi:hypothetical protein